MYEVAHEIRSATTAELPQTVDCIAAAFLTDPLTRFAWPLLAQYLEAMPAATRQFAGKSFDRDTAYVSEDVAGAALWLPPKVHADAEALEKVFRDTAKAAHLDDLLKTFEDMTGYHPSEDHWYLAFIGVEPYARGTGVGAALMRFAVQRCDREGFPAYLESTNPRNITLYMRHGFVPMGEIRVGAGPLVTPMVRQPREHVAAMG